MSGIPAALAPIRSADPLPEPLTALLGRDAHVNEILALLANARLVTLTGAGGSGKTRLALEVARRIEEGGRRVVWLELAAIGDGALLLQQLAGALHIRQLGAHDPLGEIIELLRMEPALLVLDNCEHLVADCAQLAQRILSASPDTTILTTSREPLVMPGEQTWLVPPLATADAVQLFAERARAVLPVFALEAHNTHAVELICARLDGIPLAIELAAARVKVLAVWQIVERLNDAFKLLSSGSRTLPRHRTIYETIDWSFRLLSDAERMLFGRLAVFPSTFSLDAAEAICGHDGIDSGMVLDLLSALVDKSLVLCDRSAGKSRYRLLETVHQFAAEKLDAAGETESFRARHAEFFSTLARRDEPRLFGGGADVALMAAIDDELANLRNVFDWAAEDEARAEIEAGLIYNLHWYWFARGQFEEARNRAAAAMSRRHALSERARGRVCIAAACAAVWRAEWQSLLPLGVEATEALRDDDDLRARAMAVVNIGIAHAFGAGDHDAARAPFEDALTLARACGHPIAVALMLHWIGVAAMLRQDFETARAALSEAVQIGLDTGARTAIGHPSALLGFVETQEGRHRDAATAFVRAVNAFVDIDDRWGLTHAIEGVALLLLDLGEREAGTRLLAAASAAWLQLGARPVHQTEVENEANERIQRALADERLRVVLASGASMSHDDTIAFVREQLALLLPAGTSDAPAPAASLVVNALGPFTIVRDGIAIEAASLPARAREMLVYLLCHRGGATKETIGVALWPDADAAKLRNNFHVTLHRLRKVLGDGDWIVVEGETYAIAKSVVFDVDAFERDIAARRCERAVEQYRGHFLANVTAGEWADDVRDRLRRQFAIALDQLARTRLAAGDLEGAANAYERRFALDAHDEEACRGLMLARAKQGDISGATRAYRRLADALRRDIGAEPSLATAQLHARIMSGAET